MYLIVMYIFIQFVWSVRFINIVMQWIDIDGCDENALYKHIIQLCF